MPAEIVLSRDKGWSLPEGAVAVIRPSPFANPFKVLPPTRGAYGETWRVIFSPFLPGQAHPEWATDAAETRHTGASDAALAAVEAFRRWLAEPAQAELLKRARGELRGKDLACWCPHGAYCHRTVWLELANGEGPRGPGRPNKGRRAGQKTVYLDPDNLKKLEALAEGSGESLSNVLNPLLRKALSQP